jgi:hypothetical protein
MSQTSGTARVKNVVLVHGGFVDGSGWQGVYDLLKKDGYTRDGKRHGRTSASCRSPACTRKRQTGERGSGDKGCPSH